MKNFKIYLAYVALLAMVMTSCSKEDNPDSPDGPAGDEMATLGFTALLEDFDRAMMNKQQDPDLGSVNNGLPVCSDDPAPDKVRVMLERDVDGTWEGVKDPSDGDFEIEVPVKYDPNSGTWITDEGDNDELELEEGNYRITYFAVLEGETIIYIAPRDSDHADYGPAEYGNFVSDPLPSDSFLLQKGVKKYIDVEVLCYDDHYVYRYGYLFFDFEEVDILYLCLFGNVCDEDTGRHTPAKFRFDVWNYSGDGLNPKGSILYSDTNEWGTYEETNGDAYATPLCVQLPDRPGVEDQYYGELWLVDESGAIINVEDGPIRLGVFDEEDVTNQTWAGYEVDEDGDSTSNYYHFREGACMSQDDSDPCLFKDIAYYENDFNDGETFISNGVVTGTEYDFSSTAGWTPGGTDSSAPLWAEGTYTFTSNPNDVHNHWIDFENGNDFFILNGDTQAGVEAYFSITQDDVCPGADYFVAFDILNVYNGSNSPDNDIRLIAEVDGTPLDDSDQIIVVPYNNANWTRVALRVKANSSGALDIRFVDDNTVASGNDFAIDNVVISNDPSITSPNDIEVVQD
ncbi:hypothetical protein [Salegentibacter sp. UBA1130]|uniref:hypothetical protein n=1 Tax=Salegentibacter sp. UBA1130 TaxID=1947451 RepID=UPI00257B04A6|nr:hypothetical protein [Salegentibacter sp. UBA1130]